jgi:molecular chaperone HtpG
MFITDEAALLPPWLRFVTGVVDTEDLPLNVSREMLQATPVLTKIRKAVTNRVITELKTKAKDAESYAGFWENFGAVLKEAMWDDADHRSDVIPLLRFKSSTTEGWVSFEEYVGRMKPEQDAIYVLVGDDTDTLAKSPQLEGFRARGVEVLLLADQVDAFWPERAGSILDKTIRSITQGQADLSKIPLEGDAAAEPADVTDLIAALKTALGADVSDVRATDRLVDSAVVLAASAIGPDLQMQRLLKRAGRAFGSSAPILEINPRHPLIRTLAGRTELDDAPGMLLDLARVQDGEPPRDPAGFARQMAASLAASLA